MAPREAHQCDTHDKICQRSWPQRFTSVQVTGLKIPKVLRAVPSLDFIPYQSVLSILKLLSSKTVQTFYFLLFAKMIGVGGCGREKVISVPFLLTDFIQEQNKD